MVASRNEKVALSTQIKTIEFKTVRALQPGATKLSGRVESPNRFEGPLSGKPCALYEVKIETKHSISTERTLIHREVSADGTLQFRDGTGSVAIDSTSMSLFFSNAETIETSMATVKNDRVATYVASQANLNDLKSTKPFFITEGCFQNNDILYVVGAAEIIPGTARQMKITAENGSGALANMPEREILATLDALSKRTGTLAVFFFGVILITLSVVLILYRPK